MSKTNRKTNESASTVGTIADGLSPEQIAALQSAGEKQGEELNVPGAERPETAAPASEYVRAADRVPAMQEQEGATVTARESTVMGLPQIGDNHPPTVVEEISQDILAEYKPTRSIVEASADVRETLKNIDSLSNDIHGTLTSRIALDMADIAYHCLNAKDKEGNSKPSILPNETMATQLVAHCKIHNLFGKVENVGNTDLVQIVNATTGETKGDSRIIIDKVNPYAGESLGLLNNAAMRACLLVYSHVSSVQLGYIRKSDASGKRFSRQMVFLRGDQINMAEKEEYYSAICVPTRIVIPCSYNIGRSADGKTNLLIPQKESEDNSLRHLNADWAFALYMHHFADSALVYDVESTGSKLPSGMLLKSAPKKREPQGTQASATPQSLDDAKKKIAELEKTHKIEINRLTEGKIGNVGEAETWRVVDALTSSVTDVVGTKLVPTVGIMSAARLYHAILRFRSNRFVGKDLPHALGKEMVAILNILNLNIVEKDDDYYWRDDEGNIIHKIELDDTPEERVAA